MLRASGSRGWQEGDDLGDDVFARIVRLVPDSGLHFLEVDLPRDVVEATGRSFARERVTIGGNALWTLKPADGARQAAHGPQPDTIRIDGPTALRSAFGHWLPLPMLRYVARKTSGEMQFDDGPANWARVQVVPPDNIRTTASAGNPSYRAIIAIDTELAEVSRLDAEQYAAPTLDDVRFSSVFALTDRPDDLAGFLAEPWVQAWLDDALDSPPAAASFGRVGHDLEPIALYLTLLTVLRRARIVPSMRFLSARPEAVRPRPVDLVVDVGASRTTCMLIDRDYDGGRIDMTSARLLPIRDFTRPSDVHKGAFESVVAFARASLGDEARSRMSGRSNAFQWPSLVRTGPEAGRLVADNVDGDGMTGIVSPSRFIADDAVSDESWRFAPLPRGRARRRQMVVGRMLSHTTGQGLLPPPESGGHSSVIRPQFSLSAMSSFYFAEIVLQALSAINAPTVGEERQREIRRKLNRVVLCLPSDMPGDVQEIACQRAEAAVAMLWRSLDWQSTSSPYASDAPTVGRALDATIGAQLAYLFDEVMQRYGGDAAGYLDIMGRVRPGLGARPSLRVGAVDIGATATRLTIASYSVEGNAPLRPTVIEQTSHSLAGDDLAASMVAQLIKPAMVRALARAGIADPEGFLAPFTDAAIARPKGRLDDLQSRFAALWLRPAAAALLDLDAGTTAGATRALSVAIDQLLVATGRIEWSTAQAFEKAAAEAGARDFTLGGLAIETTTRKLAAAIAEPMKPMIEAISASVMANDCDLVLLTGWPGKLATLVRLFRERLLWRPDRVVVLASHRWQTWYPLSEDDRVLCDGKDVGMVGAILAGAGEAGDARHAPAARTGGRTSPHDEVRS